MCGDGLLHGASLQKTDLSAGQNGEGAGHRDDSKTADLYQQKDDGLPEAGPVGGSVPDNESGYTDSGG